MWTLCEYAGGGHYIETPHGGRWIVDDPVLAGQVVAILNASGATWMEQDAT